MARSNPLLKAMRSFAGDKRGNIMMMFGFALVPMIGMAGAAIDYARATNARHVLSAAVDSAALMAARDATKLTDQQLRDRINNWIRGNLHGEAASSFTAATIGIDRTARTVTIAAKLDVSMTLARVIGHTSLPVSSNNQSSWGTNKIELALALDNTGSMSSSGKMTALKQASLDLIQIMKDATTETGQIKLSIVPFSTQVKLPTSYKNEAWLRWDQTRTSCSGNWWNYSCNTETIKKGTWEGCVSDRDKPYDTQDGAPVSAYETLYPADFCEQTTLATMLPLTDDWTALNARVNAMTPSGNTNVTVGAVWGMAALSPNAPFNEAQAYATPRLTKYMILLTDGDNTENRFGDSSSTIDTRTSTACTFVKNAGIKIYTIRVIDGNSTLLRSCATNTGMYYEVSSAAQLSPVFKQIANEISQVRLTQ